MGSLDFIPGVREAEVQFRDEQLEGFAGVEPDICGMISVVPLTAQIYIELSGAGNAFFNREENNGIVTPVDVAQFLWRVNPGFSRTNKELRQEFHTIISVLNFDQAVLEILEYIRRAWSAMPQWPGSPGSSPSAGVWPSRIVDMFASEYGWQEEYILNVPFRRLWQYANRILERKSDKYTHKCPEAMRLREQWLKEVNEANRLAALAAQN